MAPTFSRSAIVRALSFSRASTVRPSGSRMLERSSIAASIERRPFRAATSRPPMPCVARDLRQRVARHRGCRLVVEVVRELDRRQPPVVRRVANRVEGSLLERRRQQPYEVLDLVRR